MNKDSVAYKLMVKSKYHHRLQERIREEEEKRKREKRGSSTCSIAFRTRT